MKRHGGFDARSVRRNRTGPVEIIRSLKEAKGSSLDKAVNYGRRLLQPRYWPQLRRLLLRRLSSTPLDLNTAEEAHRRCVGMATDATAAIGALGLRASDFRSFAADHPRRLAAARARVDATHIHMGGSSDVDLLYSLCLASGAVRVLETGVAMGWSSLVILSAIAPRRGARLVSVDLPYLGKNLDDLVGLAIPPELRRYWSLYKGADRDQLQKAIASIAPIDLAHYDSDKSYRGRQWAYPRIWRGLKPGGLLLSDDVEDNLAFLDFARDVEVEPLVVRSPQSENFLGVLRKPRRRR